ncbi:PilZ domain-containing protein [Alteromonas flava]|uniref:PilZ domain-containing protein n=1 Tax=Alteromonas flava TaxID=2048003 RepID=UPI000C29138D|nr:PilZ domain-containing protein [Alteromonas flava]
MTKNKNSKVTGISADDLASLRALQPGSIVDLQVSTPTSPKRVKTTYVGMDYPRSLIFQFPNMKKYGVMKDVLYPENTVIIRYVLEGQNGQVIAFKAKINHIQSQPGALFFTTFPRSLQSLGLRSEKRASPGIAAELTLAEQGNALNTLIVDVSQSGCRIALAQALLDDMPADAIEPEQPVTLCVDLSEKTVILEGIIRNSKADDGYVFLGIQFATANNDVDILLKRHIINV